MNFHEITQVSDPFVRGADNDGNGISNPAP
jgi:hypothetical protein